MENSLYATTASNRLFDQILKKMDYRSISRMVKSSPVVLPSLNRLPRPVGTVPESDGHLLLQNPIHGSVISFVPVPLQVPQDIPDLSLFSFETIVVSNLAMSTYRAQIQGRIAIAASRCSTLKLMSPLHPVLLDQLIRDISPTTIVFKREDMDPEVEAIQDIPHVHFICSPRNGYLYSNGLRIVNLLVEHIAVTMEVAQIVRTEALINLVKFWFNGEPIADRKVVTFHSSRFYENRTGEREQIMQALEEFEPRFHERIEDEEFRVKIVRNYGHIVLLFQGHNITVSFL